jgi:hypothetical protein
MADLRVVSERSEKEIKQQEVNRALQEALVNLAANLMRVARGAGKPYLITQHVRDFATRMLPGKDVYERPADEWEFHQLLKFQSLILNFQKVVLRRQPRSTRFAASAANRRFDSARLNETARQRSCGFAFDLRTRKRSPCKAG